MERNVISPDAADVERPAALVLAGSRGMGYGSAHALAAGGFRVAITGRDPAGLEEARQQLLSDGADVRTVVSDVAHADALADVFERVADEFGRLDALVANAGSPDRGPFPQLGEESWQAAFDLTLMSVVRAVGHARTRMRPSGGRIVVIGSSSVRRPIPNLSISNTLRPALAGLVKDLGGHLAPEGITINMVSPGRVDTGHARRSDERRAAQRGVSYEDVRAEFEASIPMGRYGTADEFGAFVAFLASPAAAYVTGQSVLVDGGQVATLP